jgi:hypothetical protein
MPVYGTVQVVVGMITSSPLDRRPGEGDDRVADRRARFGVLRGVDGGQRLDGVALLPLVGDLDAMLALGFVAIDDAVGAQREPGERGGRGEHVGFDLQRREDGPRLPARGAETDADEVTVLGRLVVHVEGVVQRDFGVVRTRALALPERFPLLAVEGEGQ